MKTQNNFEPAAKKVISYSTLYRLCNEKQWFTCGDNRQYNIMFTLAEEGISLEELTLIIFLCSNDSRKNIRETLRPLFEA